jgi:hypothetical protein
LKRRRRSARPSSAATSSMKALQENERWTYPSHA